MQVGKLPAELRRRRVNGRKPHFTISNIQWENSGAIKSNYRPSEEANPPINPLFGLACCDNFSKLVPFRGISFMQFRGLKSPPKTSLRSLWPKVLSNRITRVLYIAALTCSNGSSGNARTERCPDRNGLQKSDRYRRCPMAGRPCVQLADRCKRRIPSQLHWFART